MMQNNPIKHKNEFDNQGGEFGDYGDGNTIGLGFDNQNPLNEMNIELPKPQPSVQKTTTTPSTTSTPLLTPDINNVTLPTNMDVCPFCKSIHPPLRPGEQCPNAGLNSKDQKKFNVTNDIINKYIITLKDIIMNNMSSKNIVDGAKFFQYAILELTKSLESYEE